MRTSLLTFLLSLLFIVPLGAQEVYKTILVENGLPITIDGDLSDWRGVEVKPQKLKYICTYAGRELSPPTSAADLSANFRCVLDKENIYVAVEVFDDKIIFGEEEFGSAHKDDAVEVYFDGDLTTHKQSRGEVDYDANDAEIRFSKRRDGTVVLEGMGLFGDRLIMLPGLWESLGIVAAIKENPKGYIAELKVPKIVFIAPPLTVGSKFGFNVMINDDDDGGDRDSKISWTPDFKDESWYTTRYFGRVVIVKSIR